MSNIIFSCNNGIITQGVIAANEPFYKTKIFVDDPINLIGFRTSLKTYVNKSKNQIVEYFEIGYFMEMLYEGKYEAFNILKMDKEYIDFNFYDFNILQEKEEHLISRKLIDNLMNDAKTLYKSLEDPEELGLQIKENKNNFVIEKLAYNNKNAYICLRNLILIESILKNYKFEIKQTSLPILQGIRDGKFSLSAIKEGWDLYMKNIEELEKNSNIPLRPDHSTMNEILLKIRNIKLETLNVTTG